MYVLYVVNLGSALVEASTARTSVRIKSDEAGPGP